MTTRPGFHRSRHHPTDHPPTSNHLTDRPTDRSGVRSPIRAALLLPASAGVLSVRFGSVRLVCGGVGWPAGSAGWLLTRKRRRGRCASPYRRASLLAEPLFHSPDPTPRAMTAFGLTGVHMPHTDSFLRSFVSSFLRSSIDSPPQTEKGIGIAYGRSMTGTTDPNRRRLRISSRFVSIH